MKKVLFGLTALFAVVAFMVAPAAADLKLTSKGYFQVQGLLLDGNPIDDKSRTNDWYNMEMIITPTLHINDKVRIHSQVRIMERNYSGTGAGDSYGNGNEANSRYSIYGDSQNNFWVERLYVSLPVMNGDLRIGRMSGGTWGHAFGDTEQNRDRVLYIGKPFGGDVTVVFLPIEKLYENDGGLNAPKT